MVVNCAKDFYKQQKPTEPLEDSIGYGQSTTTQGEQLVLLRQVLEKIENMGAGYKETVVLVAGEGLSHAQTAQVLAVKESTISWRMHEVRKRLSVHLQPEDRYE